MSVYEIKFRRKGEVKIWKDFYQEDLPEEIKKEIPSGLLGIDLTAYSVISISTRRSCVEQARATLVETRAIVVYMYSWSNGYGQGVLVPERFNPKQIKYYKTQSQQEEEDEVSRGVKMDQLIQEAEKKFPKYIFRKDLHNEHVEVAPRQEVFSNWSVYVTEIQEISEAIDKMAPLWNEWNTRGVETYTRRTGETPQIGMLQLYRSPTDAKREVIGLRIHFMESLPAWVWYQKNGETGQWAELEQLYHGPPPGV